MERPPTAARQIDAGDRWDDVAALEDLHESGVHGGL
jgi:hypothetical protein